MVFHRRESREKVIGLFYSPCSRKKRKRNLVMTLSHSTTPDLFIVVTNKAWDYWKACEEVAIVGMPVLRKNHQGRLSSALATERDLFLERQ